MLADAGKSVVEGDTEVSEAIDFAEYYSRSLDTEGWTDGTTSQPVGVVVVTPPWNFPYAIPAGGCLAALMAGNTVILKPAPETVLTAWHLVCQLWNAGVPREVLQFLPLEDGERGKSLICDERVGIVVLTGAYQTAKLFQSWRPDLRLYAETSGKNSMIISSAADLDLAVKDLVQGAFGHAGQKCSATSLAIVQRDVYESRTFRSQLKDAASSLQVASAWDLSAEVTPLIRPPGEDLKRGLTKLDKGESWLLQPRMIDDNPCLWSPGIRLGVKPGSWFHRTECFGPVLGLIAVDSLEKAFEIQNDSEFGLTGGLHSLDTDEIDQWREAVQVGNAYVNRSTTGAIVRRQPFGGWKHSSVGPGTKAGGPNYVAAFRDWEQHSSPRLQSSLPPDLRQIISRLSGLLSTDQERDRLRSAAGSYLYWWKRHFSKEHDPSQLHGEDNHFRYRPNLMHWIRIQHESDSLFAVLASIIACRIAGIRLELSVNTMPDWAERLPADAGVQVTIESVSQLIERIPCLTSGSLRVLGNDLPDALYSLRNMGHKVITSNGLLNGRIEWQNYLKNSRSPRPCIDTAI